jgi:hypothetical protein
VKDTGHLNLGTLKVNEIFSFFYDVLVLKIFLICPTARSESGYYFGFQGKEGSESKTHCPEFLSSQVGNPNYNAGIKKVWMTLYAEKILSMKILHCSWYST